MKHYFHLSSLLLSNKMESLSSRLWLQCRNEKRFYLRFMGSLSIMKAFCLKFRVSSWFCSEDEHLTRNCSWTRTNLLHTQKSGISSLFPEEDSLPSTSWQNSWIITLKKQVGQRVSWLKCFKLTDNFWEMVF